VVGQVEGVPRLAHRHALAQWMRGVVLADVPGQPLLPLLEGGGVDPPLADSLADRRITEAQPGQDDGVLRRAGAEPKVAGGVMRTELLGPSACGSAPPQRERVYVEDPD